MAHHALDLPPVIGLRGPLSVEVWDDTPEFFEPAHVTLYVGGDIAEIVYVKMAPSEARALAALLVNAAEHQERAS